MKKQNIILLCIAFSIGLLSSCNDFLEPKSNSEYVPKDAVSLNEILLGEGYMHPNDQTKLHVFMDILDDDVQCSSYSATKQNENRYPALAAAFSWDVNMFHKFSEAGIHETGTNIWKNGYTKILGTNAVMDYIEGSMGTEIEKNMVKAQAFALRGYYHFYLVNVFALPYNIDKSSPGIPIRTSSKMQDEPLKRNTVEEVYAQILSDLHASEELYLKMPIDLQFKRDYRVSLPMVNLLLSRVYLYMENWEKASLYAQKVLDDTNFKLLDLNTITGNSPYNFISINSPETIWLYGNATDIFDFAIDRWRIGYRQITIFVPSQELMSSYENDDLRKTWYFVNQYNTGNYTPYSKISIARNTGLITANNQFGRAFRLSEAYLNLAEASSMLAKAGKNEHKVKAVQAINTLRMNRYKTNTDFSLKEESIEVLIDAIKQERRKELCFEGHRWFDLKRYGMPEIKHRWHVDETTTLDFTLHPKDKRYVLPIPFWTLELNKNLTPNHPGK
ncbi:MAG: RagB/SusD family nutrient uptake outer membrane protein [Bacteroidia bacterium]|nr:RagB/SusD family nutrient uptake outer membrane protein [Bacteroidia bacterium]